MKKLVIFLFFLFSLTSCMLEYDGFYSPSERYYYKPLYRYPYYYPYYYQYWRYPYYSTPRHNPPYYRGPRK